MTEKVTVNVSNAEEKIHSTDYSLSVNKCFSSSSCVLFPKFWNSLTMTISSAVEVELPKASRVVPCSGNTAIASCGR